MFLKLTLTQKYSPKGPKKLPQRAQKMQKRPKMCPNIKQKVRAVLPKPKLIVYICRSQKVCEPTQAQKNSPFTFQFSIPNFQIPNFQILNFQITNFWIPNFQILNFQIQNAQIPNFQIPNFRILNFQIPNFWIPKFWIPNF